MLKMHRAGYAVVLPELYKFTYFHRCRFGTSIRIPSQSENKKMAESVRREAMLRKDEFETSALQDFFNAELAESLGKVEHRLLEKLRLLDEKNEVIKEILKQPVRDVAALTKAVEAFNRVQREALQARQELIVQRESAGFWLDSTSRINDRYPIPPEKRVKGQAS
jgi:hypothetical protein